MPEDIGSVRTVAFSVTHCVEKGRDTTLPPTRGPLALRSNEFMHPV